MTSAYKENAIWVEWQPLTAELAYTARFDLTQIGPRERRAYNERLRECRDGPQTTNPLDKLAINAGIASDPENACWWDVTMFGWTVETTITTPGVATLLDPRASGLKNVPCYGVVRYLGDEILFDIGAGAHFSVFAQSLGIGVMCPTATFAVGNAGTSNFIGTLGNPLNVVSTNVFGQIGACTRPVSAQTIKFTQTFTMAAARNINIPARARTLQIFQNTASLPAAPLNWVSGPISLFDLGEIDFDTAVAPARTSILEIPAMATIVQTGASVRTLTFVWGLAL